MKTFLLFIILICMLLAGSLILVSSTMPPEAQQSSVSHIYASWETMEYDKCAAAWVIKRFVDREAEFAFYPNGTEIQEGVVFDVPGAAWSRQHLKCTSDCILETYQFEDPAIKGIIEMAHNIELNFWQLDSFPDAQESFHQLRIILESNQGNLNQCIEKTSAYFDDLYASLKQNSY